MLATIPRRKMRSAALSEDAGSATRGTARSGFHAVNFDRFLTALIVYEFHPCCLLPSPMPAASTEIKLSVSHQTREKIGDPYCHRRRAVKA